MVILETRDLGKHVGDHHATADVTFTAKPGEVHWRIVAEVNPHELDNRDTIRKYLAV